MSRGSNPTKVQQWSDRLSRFEESGQSVTQFCLAEGVSQPSFYQWRRKLGGTARVGRITPKRSSRSKHGESPTRGTQDEPAFKAVQVTALPGIRRTLIRLTDGVEIELGDNLPVVELVVRSVIEQVLPNPASRTEAQHVESDQ